MIAYKAFQKNLSCLGFQYKETEWNYTEKAACRKTGFHCAENPLDCLIYYSNPDLAQYCVVEVAGERQEEGDDSKIACTQLRIVRRLTLLELLIEGVAYMLQYPHRRPSKIIQIEKRKFHGWIYSGAWETSHRKREERYNPSSHQGRY